MHAPSLDPSIVTSQVKLSKMSDKDLSDQLADTCIALAIKTGSTPREILKTAMGVLAFTDEQWRQEVLPNLILEMSAAPAAPDDIPADLYDRECP